VKRRKFEMGEGHDLKSSGNGAIFPMFAFHLLFFDFCFWLLVGYLLSNLVSKFGVSY
jgi:hypothetical protein